MNNPVDERYLWWTSTSKAVFRDQRLLQEVCFHNQIIIRKERLPVFPSGAAQNMQSMKEKELQRAIKTWIKPNAQTIRINYVCSQMNPVTSSTRIMTAFTTVPSTVTGSWKLFFPPTGI